MIHLEGMGVIGCYLAHRLAADGIDFTWFDSNEPVTAWRACTGAIFPTGHAEDELARAVWGQHLFDPAFRTHMESAAYVFCSKQPPHGGRAGFQPLAGNAKLLDTPSLHLNAQRWVPWTREVFEDRRARPQPRRGATVVVTHGFGQRLARYMWGWTVPVRVLTTAEMETTRACIYFRRGRFTMAYAYPIPCTNTWYAGSSLISQQKPRSLEIAPKFERWRRDFMELGAGYITDVQVAGDPIEGWRPTPFKSDTPLVRPVGGKLAVRPLWHSGVRHAPLVYNALKEAIR